MQRGTPFVFHATVYAARPILRKGDGYIDPMVTPNAAGASVRIASGTLLSRMLGLGRSMLLVAAIGSTGIAADAFGTASQVTNVIYTLVATGVLSSVLVPQLTRASLRADGGAEYVNKLITLTLTGSVALCALIAALLPLLMGWLGSQWSAPGQLGLATGFAFWLLPQIIFFALYTVLGEVLNSRSRFGPYAWTPVLNNVVSIGGLVVFLWLMGADPNGQRTVANWPAGGTALLAGAATLGVALQAITLFAFLRGAGVTFRPDFNFRGTGLGVTARLGGWTFLGVLVSQIIALLLNQAMNRAAGNEAGIAAWQLASLVTVLPHSIIVISLVTSRFTRMSVAAERGDTRPFKRDFVTLSRLTVVAITFCAVVIAVLAGPITRVLMSGARVESLYPVMIVVACHATGAVAFSLLFVFNRAFFAYSNTRSPFLIQLVIAIGSLATIATSFMLPSGTATAFITLGTNLLFWIQLVITFLVLRRRLGRIGGRSIARALVQCMAGGLLALGAGIALLQAFGGITVGSFALSGVLPALVSAISIVSLMGIVYAGALFALKNEEMRGAWACMRRRLEK